MQKGAEADKSKRANAAKNVRYEHAEEDLAKLCALLGVDLLLNRRVHLGVKLHNETHAAADLSFFVHIRVRILVLVI